MILLAEEDGALRNVTSRCFCDWAIAASRSRAAAAFDLTTGVIPASPHLEGLGELSVQVLHEPYGLNDLARAVRRGSSSPGSA